LPLDAGRFDLVIDFGTCYHVGGGEAGVRAALREIAVCWRGWIVRFTRHRSRSISRIRAIVRASSALA